MTTLREIESAIHELPETERWELLHRFEQDLWNDWDRKIEADLREGKLDELLREARSEISGGKTRPLNEILHDR